MTWAAPVLLQGLWGVPLLGLLLAFALRRRRDALRRMGPLVSERVGAGAARVHRARAWLTAGALGLVVVALAQPRWGYRWQELRRQGLDLVVVLDVSRSMDAEDVSPSRMERARREVLDLTDVLAGDRVGLVLFARSAYPRMPLTLDYGVLRRMVRDSSVETLLAQGSDLGAAIETGVALLGAPGAADRALLVISDGEDHGGRAVEAARAAAEGGVRIYAIGVGTEEGAPIPLDDGGFKKDAGGRVVLSRIDEDTLEAIAQAGGGAYVRSVGGAGDLRAIYQDEIRGKLRAAELGVRREKVWDERYQWPLAAAFLLLLAGAALRPGALRLPAAAAGALVAFGLGARAEEATDWKGRAEALAAEHASRPDDLALAERLGEALYRAGEYDRAEDVLDAVADRTRDPEQRRRARYDSGLAAYRGGRLVDALDDWKRVLAERPDDGPAATNAESVERELAIRLREAEETPKEGEESQEGEGQPSEGGEPQSDPSGEEAEPGVNEATGSEGATEPGAEGEPGTTGGARDTGEPAGGLAPAGEISPQEAARLLDSVEEGTPRVEAREKRAGGKDW